MTGPYVGGTEWEKCQDLEIGDRRLVAIVIRLVGSVHWNAEILRLI